MRDASPPQRGPAGTYTVTEASARFGMSEWSAYEAIRSNNWPTPVVKIGRRLYILREPFEHFLEAGSL